MQHLFRIIILVMALVAGAVTARGNSHADDSDIMLVDIDVDVTPPDTIVSLEAAEVLRPTMSKGAPISSPTTGKDCGSTRESSPVPS